MTTSQILAMLRDEGAPVDMTATIAHIEGQEALVKKAIEAAGLDSIEQLQQLDGRVPLVAENEHLRNEVAAYREKLINQVAGQMALLGKDEGAIDRFRRRAAAMDVDQLHDEAEAVAERLRERFRVPRLSQPSDNVSAIQAVSDFHGFRV